MDRPIYIMGNWKMNTSYSEAMVLVSGVLRNTEEYDDIKVVFFPPSLWLVPIKESYKTAQLGAQNIFSHISGPYTGEISPYMLKGIAKYVLIGHSERRSIFNEDDAIVNSKLHTTLDAHLTPVLAVGEEEEIDIEELQENEIEKRIENSRLGKSLISSTRGLSQNEWEKIIIAYEPVWAIGTGKNASGAYAAKIIKGLRRIIMQKTNKTIASDVPILYGGSVTHHSAAEYASQPTIDGVLVGGASLKITEFSGIAEAFNESKKWRQQTDENG